LPYSNTPPGNRQYLVKIKCVSEKKSSTWKYENKMLQPNMSSGATRKTLIMKLVIGDSPGNLAYPSGNSPGNLVR
jgi:hypothetical protein